MAVPVLCAVLGPTALVPAGAVVAALIVYKHRDNIARLCAGHAVRWLALAVHRQGVIVMPVRQGPPPGSLATDDRLCAVVALNR